MTSRQTPTMLRGCPEGLRSAFTDPRTFQLLEVARQILTTHYEDTQAVLDELAQPMDDS